jgi:hypothetical protein
MSQNPPVESTTSAESKFHIQIFTSDLEISHLQRETPTTFVPLCPDRIKFDNGMADLLFGVFHVKWADMPKPSTYALKISDLVSREGSYIGARLETKFPAKLEISLIE